jgi:hypothetical protein
MLVPLAVLAFWSYFGLISFHPAWPLQRDCLGMAGNWNLILSQPTRGSAVKLSGSQNLNLRQIVNDSGSESLIIDICFTF